MTIETVIERAAGLDIAKASLVACVRVPKPDGGWQVCKRKFSTMTADLGALADWLAAHQVTRVGMESTSDYWRPVFYLLEDRFECWLLNARHMRTVPGRKTDMTDAEWICDLVAHGLVRPSFVPPPPIRRLRDLTRRRSLLLADGSREKQRMEKLLEDAGVKLSVVASDLFSKSGRAMLEALIAGERNPRVLAELARGRLRAKIGALTEALAGRFDEHHAFLARMILTHLDAISAMLTELDARIDAELAPYRPQVELLTSIDGIQTRTAQVIIAEIGVDMSRFPSAAHLASWAGVCPGNNKTAGKPKTASTRPGNRWLKAALGTAALGALRRKDSYLHALFRRIAARRGGKRALAAVGHSQLVTIWHVLTTQTRYQNLGGDYFLRRDNPEHRRRRAVDQLQRLGYRVILQPAA